MNTTPSPSSYGNELYGLSCTRDGTVCMAVGGSQIDQAGNKDVSLTMAN